jgi:hypothetical protein
MSYTTYIDGLQDLSKLKDSPTLDHLDLYSAGIITETDDEFGGYIIDLDKIPKNIKYLHIYKC